MSLKYLLKINIFLLVAYSAAYFLNEYYHALFFLKATLGISVIFLSGFNFTVILKIISKKEFDFWETVNFSFLAVIILFPLILSLEFIFLKEVRNFFPIMNLFAIFIILFLTAKIKKINWNDSFITVPKIKAKEAIVSPLFTIIIIKIIIVITIFSAYEFLPDKDPFKWLFRLSDLFEKNSLSPETYRPFFSGLTYIFTKITGISIFIFFKYIIPFFSLSIIFSVWLVARRMKNKNTQLLMLLASLMTSNVILYSQTAMPQIFAIYLTYYFISFLLYYNQTKDFFYYTAAGAISFFAIFFHEISAVFFFIWLSITFIFFSKNIQIRKKDILYIIIIILSNISILKVNFIYTWLRKLALLAKDIKPNFLFPAHYVNIDGNEMGWEGLLGILKFYSYYIGPFLLFIFALSIYYLIKDHRFRSYMKEKFKSKELFILLGCFFVFFAISEIFPRIIGISILPDRSWIFGGIFSTLFLFILLNYLEDKNIMTRNFLLLSFALLIIIIYGSAYINNQKKFLITENEIYSSKWIKENLPEDRIIISASPSSVIKYYSKSNLISVPIKFYYNENSLDIFKNKNNILLVNDSDLLEYSKNAKENSEKLISSFNEESTDITQKTKIFSETAIDNMNSSKILLNKINLSRNNALYNSQNLYIYYSEKSRNNPYVSRPYELDKNLQVNEFAFDKYPDKFTRIFEKGGDGKVIIWKVL